MSIKTETFLENIREQHTATVQYGLDSIDQLKLQAAATMIALAIRHDRRIYTIGNGASASIAQHWACDYTKGCSSLNSSPPVRPHVISLSANIPLLTAIGNDVDFREIYSHQLERLADRGDLLITISSSGSSPNVIEALKTAKKMHVDTISLTGFNGGQCRDLSDVHVNVNVHEYEATEDCHSAIMHMIAKYIRLMLWS